ncbi:hypothetical protein M9Y10_008029 [Tritrichomonas musculus]|uniref:HEAT repeat-containing protein 1 n=1 Tax=Tritrichomonas musculus TaxID=1915356 RepID=A0ABR2IXV0_9EUKA
MEKIIQSLQTIAKSQRILQPEQTIELWLMPLYPYWNEKSSEITTEIVPKIENTLLSLLKINRGDLNVACATSIGINLYHLYSLDPHKHFWNLISNVTDFSTKANIVAFKYVVSKLGMYNKSSLGKITQHLLSLKDQSLHYPALLALKSLFKACRQSLSKSASAAFKFAKGYSNFSSSTNEATQIAALHLLDTLLQYSNEVPTKKVINCAKKVISNPSNTKFVIDTSARLIAKCAIFNIPEDCMMKKNIGDDGENQNIDGMDIRDSANDSDFKIKASNNSNDNFTQSPIAVRGNISSPKKRKDKNEPLMKKAFDTILEFKTNFPLIFGYFLDYLEPSFVHRNMKDLFEFAVNNSISHVKKVTSFFGRDIHSMFFTSTLNMKNVNVQLLNFLTYDEDSARETAGIAHQKIWSKNESERYASSIFFISVATSYQKVGLEELHVALHFIAMPPDASETLDREYEGMALAAAVIISSLNCSIAKEKPLIDRFVKYIFEEKIHEPLYVRCLFNVIAPLKKEFFEKYDVEQLFEKVATKIIDSYNDLVKLNRSEDGDNINMNNVINGLPIRLIESLLIFVSIHHEYKMAEKYGNFCFSILQYLSPVSILSILRLFNVKNNFDLSSSFVSSLLTFFMNYVINTGVPLDYIKKKIPVLMKIPEEVVVIDRNTNKIGKKKNILAVSPLFIVESQVLVTKIFDSLPKYFAKLSKEDAELFINFCLESTNKIAGYLAILMILLRDEELREQEEQQTSTNTTTTTTTNGNEDGNGNDQLSEQKVMSLIIPKKLHMMILNSMKQSEKDNDTIAIQIASECVAIHLAKLPEFLSDINENIKTENVSCCFIESAVARRLNLSDQELYNIIFRTSERIKNQNLTNYVLHELASIYDTKSIQMVSLLMGDQQMQQLLNLLCEARVVSTYKMYLISMCIQKLIPILLPNFGDKSTVIMVILALHNFKNCINPYCKQYFFDLFRTIFSYSHKVARNFSIKIPQTSMRIQSKLAACGALSDLLKISPFKVNFQNLPPFFVLLQRTKDVRIEQFLTASASSFSTIYTTTVEEHSNDADFEEKKVKLNKELANWFKLSRQILASNSMIGFGKITIEPNTIVKHASLNILKVILPSLAKTKPLMTACMDDCIASALRAIETRRFELQEIAYDIITEFLDLFKYFITDQGVKLLELYESQFSNATRYAFPDSISVASQFLVSYLDFSFEVYQKNEKSCLLLTESLINSLKKVQDKDRTSGFYAISSKLCVISQLYEKVAECSSSYLKELTPLFLNLIKDIIKLRTQPMKQNETEHSFLSLFTETVSPFYEDFLNSFIWLTKMFPVEECKTLTTQSLSSFLLLELTSSTESWRSASAFSAFSSLLQFYGSSTSEIDNDLFELIVNTMCNVALWNKKLLRPLVPKFLHYAAKISCERKDDKVWSSFASVALQTNHCDGKTLGLILKHTDSKIIINSIMKFADLVVLELSESLLATSEIAKATEQQQQQQDQQQDRLSSSSSQVIEKVNSFILNADEHCDRNLLLLSEDEAIAVITILYDMCKEAIPEILSRVLAKRIKGSVRFQMVAIERAFKRIETTIALDRVASFIYENFDNGGLETVAQITIQRPLIGCEILKRGVVSRSVIVNNENCEPEGNSSSLANSGLTILHFYELILDKFESIQVLCEEIAKASLYFVSIFGNDRVRGEKVSATAIQLIKRCAETQPKAFEIAFESLSNERKGEVMKAIKKWSSKKIVKKVSLLKFSSRTPRRRNNDDAGEWQSLDDDE